MAAGLPLETLTRKIVTLDTFYDIVTLLQYDWLAIVLLRNCVCVYLCSTCTDRDVDICTEIACNVVNPGDKGELVYNIAIAIYSHQEYCW